MTAEEERATYLRGVIDVGLLVEQMVNDGEHSLCEAAAGREAVDRLLGRSDEAPSVAVVEFAWMQEDGTVCRRRLEYAALPAWALQAYVG